MTEIEKAIQEFEDNLYHESLKPTISDKSKIIALKALQEKAERMNPQPLTLEQLRGMDGEPVYCIDTKNKGKWALVHTHDEICADSDYGDWEFYSYGWTDSDVGWTAYRAKPEQEAEK